MTAKLNQMLRRGLFFAAISSLAGLPGHALSQSQIDMTSSSTSNVAVTPPMGWNPFNAFRLDYDESDIFKAADALVALKLDRAGYHYVNIDDGWWLKRQKDTIAIRTNLFPSADIGGGRTSFRPFVDRLHAMGLKAGIYTDIAYNNCSQHWDKDSPNLPTGSVAEREVGAMGHYRGDARLYFADWGFDFIKVDACGVADYGPNAADVKAGMFRMASPLIIRNAPATSDGGALAKLYADFSRESRLAAPHRPPLFAICAWGEADVNDWAGQSGQMWRTSADIRPTWKSMLYNFDSAAPRALFAGPGRWNDPDLLEIGNGEFDAKHLTEARAHMSMWSIISAPLMLSYDLTKAPAAIHEIVGNAEVIAINQDAAGNQGVILDQSDDNQVIVKQLSRPGLKAVAVINRSDKAISTAVKLSSLHLDPYGPLAVRDVWRQTSYPVDNGRIAFDLAPHETALLVVEGRPLDVGIIPSELPARIMVTKVGFRPNDRSTTRQWIPARIGYSPDGKPLGDSLDARGRALGVAAGSIVRIALEKQFGRIQITPKAMNNVGEYAIFADGKLLSRKVADGKPMNLQVKGATYLDLVAPPHDAANPWFVWADIALFSQSLR